MKTVYFVRHGETDNNAAKRYNSPDTPLSEMGKKQAIEIGERCAKLPIELIVASTYERAQQTAEVVGKKMGKHIESSELFVELSFSSRLNGMSVDHPDATVVVDEYFKNFSDPDFRYEDGENFNDLKERAQAGLEYLEKKSENNILVVSHAGFMWIIVAAAVFGSELSAEECRGVIGGFDLMENTGLTVIRHAALSHKAVGGPTSHWQLWIWNDHAHLG